MGFALSVCEMEINARFKIVAFFLLPWKTEFSHYRHDLSLLFGDKAFIPKNLLQ